MTTETANFIPRNEIAYIELHATLEYYLIILEGNQGTWYAKEFTAEKDGLKGDFHDDRF